MYTDTRAYFIYEFKEFAINSLYNGFFRNNYTGIRIVTSSADRLYKSIISKARKSGPDEWLAAGTVLPRCQTIRVRLEQKKKNLKIPKQRFVSAVTFESTVG